MSKVNLDNVHWKLMSPGDCFPQAHLNPGGETRYPGYEPADNIPCAHCGHVYDQTRCGDVTLPGSDYENDWFYGVRGWVVITAFACMLCGGVSGLAMGEHKGALRLGFVFTDDSQWPGPLLRDDEDAAAD